MYQTNRRNYYYGVLAFGVILCLSCHDYLDEFAANSNQSPIVLQGQIVQENTTRANDYGFVAGDKMGVYIVDYEDGTAGTLGTDNRASNLIYTFDADTYHWSAPTTIYWRDETTPVDVYGYYPAANYIANPSAYSFEVQADQSREAQNGDLSTYEQSDLLWGKTTKATPSEQTITVCYNHILAGVRVKLNKGTGISDTEWTKLEKLVTVDNTIRTANVDLATGVVSSTGSYDRPVRMLLQSNDYRAVVIPQTVDAGKALISITIDGISYSHKLTSPMKYQAGKLHNFTITVNKSETTGEYSISVADNGITPWVNDESSHQFTAMAYVTVHCPQYGRLKQCITDAGYDYKTVQNLKVTGELTTEDFILLRDEMPELRHLNLKDVMVRHIYHSYWTSDYNGSLVEYYLDDELPSSAFYQNQSIRSIVLPKTLKRIGAQAFRESRLMFSTLEIPEGVTFIDEWAFAITDNGGGVELILPSTIDTICSLAFYNTDYKCEFILSDNIRYLGSSMVYNGNGRGAPNFYGTIHIPSKLTSINRELFQGLGSNGSFNGQLEIPQGITEIGDEAFGISFANKLDLVLPRGVKRIGRKAFSGLPFNSIHFNDDLEVIGPEAFYASNLHLSVVLPPNLREIGYRAFCECALEGEVIVPENCLTIGGDAFCGNGITKVTLPSRLETISDGMFRQCGMLREVNIPKYVDYIGDLAFADCYSMQTIICLNPEPPTLGERAFEMEFDKVVLQVPEASIEAYRHADGWNEFKNITPYRELAFNIPEIVALDKGNTLEGILRAEGAWEVSECPDWVTVSPSSGQYKAELTITVKPMNIEGERDGRIVFRLKDKDYTYYTTVHQYNSAAYREDQTIVLQQASAGASHEIPFFIVGEGYTAEEIVSGQYFNDMKEQMEHLFSIEPYKTYRNYFTVSTAIACSPEHGLEGRTRFNTGIDYYFNVFYTDENRVWEYAEQHARGMGWDSRNRAVVMMLINTNQLFNTVKLDNDGYALALLGMSTDSYPFDQREMVLRDVGGRAFGHLASEAVNHFTFLKSCTCPGCSGWGEYQHGKRLGWYDNIAITSRMNEVPWSHLIFHPKYAAYVDVFEGAYNHARGTYRSENMSVMGNVPIPYFNTISRESIVRRIMKAAGKTFDFNEFVTNDKIEIPE